MASWHRSDALAALLGSTAAYRLISVALASITVLAGLSVWPHTAPPEDAIAFTPAVERRLSLPATLPAFVLDDDFTPHQCGRLFTEAGSRLLLSPYDDRRCRDSAVNATAIIYAADIRLLWALLTETERGEIYASLRETTFWLRQSLQSSLTETFFDTEYRPVIRDILRSSLERTLRKPSVREALERGIASVDPRLVDSVIAGIVPVAIEHIETSLWTNLRSLATGWLGSGSEASGAGQVMIGTLRDPRVRNHLDATLPNLLASPGLADAAVMAASEFVGVLIEDSRVPQLIQQIMTDRRITAAAGLARTALPEGLPRKLLKLRSAKDHNPLSAYVVRLLMHGRGGSVLLLLEPDQQARLSSQAGSGIILTQVKHQ